MQSALKNEGNSPSTKAMEVLSIAKFSYLLSNRSVLRLPDDKVTSRKVSSANRSLS